MQLLIEFNITAVMWKPSMKILILILSVRIRDLNIMVLKFMRLNYYSTRRLE